MGTPTSGHSIEVSDLLEQLRELVFANVLLGAKNDDDIVQALIPHSLQVILLGHVFWIVAYGFSALRAHRDGLLAIPAVAICLNITWEAIILSDCLLLGSFEGLSYCPGSMGDASMLAIATIFVLDTVLLVQALIITGRQRGLILSFLLFSLGLAAAFAFHLGFMAAIDDWGGVIDSWIINLVMSILFVVAAVSRPRAAGLSFTAGWTKMLGSLAVAVGLWIHPDGASLDPPRMEAFLWLALAVLLLDIVYIVLLAKRQPSQDLTA